MSILISIDSLNKQKIFQHFYYFSRVSARNVRVGGSKRGGGVSPGEKKSIILILVLKMAYFNWNLFSNKGEIPPLVLSGGGGPDSPLAETLLSHFRTSKKKNVYR